MSDKIREAFDAWIASVDKRRDANGWEPLTARDVNMLREGYMEAALAQQPAAAVPEGWKLVPVESSIEMEEAGRKAASRLMGLSEANRVYRAMLAAAPAAPVAVQEPVAWVLLHNGEVAYDRDEAIISNRPGDCLDESYEWRAVYAAPAAPVAVQPLPYWAPCNPACDPELNGRRSERCDCAQAKAALGDQSAAAPAAPVAQEPVRELIGYACDRRGALIPDRCGECLCWSAYQDAPPATEQPDTVAVPRELLAEAESIIESYAEALMASHAPGGDWDGEEAAHDEYELEAGVASKLRALLAGGAE